MWRFTNGQKEEREASSFQKKELAIEGIFGNRKGGKCKFLNLARSILFSSPLVKL